MNPENTRPRLNTCFVFVFHTNAVPSHGSFIFIGLIFIHQEVIHIPDCTVPMEQNKRRRIDGND